MKRIDHIISIHINKVYRQLGYLSSKKTIPVLMYHSISDGEETYNHSYYNLNTSPILFEEQMNYLKRNNYMVIGLGALFKYMMQNDSQKYVVITFDDGYEDFYMNAFPILNKYGFTATVFLPTEYIDKKDLKFNGKNTMNWDQIRDLSENKIDFGAHTVHHAKLHTLSRKEIENEISVSKMRIEQQLGKVIDTFCYPYAYPENDRKFTAEFKSILRKNSIRINTTTIIGTNNEKTDPLQLKRLPVNSTDQLQIFDAKLNGGYNWLHFFQFYYKYIKKYISEDPQKNP